MIYVMNIHSYSCFSSDCSHLPSPTSPPTSPPTTPPNSQLPPATRTPPRPSFGSISALSVALPFLCSVSPNPATTPLLILQLLVIF